MVQVHPLLEAYRPSTAEPFDQVKAAHLLNRAGFGGTPEEIAKVVKLGPQDAVDWLMDFPEAPAEEQSPSDVPDLSVLDGFPRNFREIQRMTVGKTEEERRQIQQRFMAANREALGEAAGWWLKRMAYGPHALQEKLTLFWHGHFTTSARDERQAQLMWKQNELLRRQGAGNFREFVRQISRDPAMLDYLNNQQNRKQHPNENYARELMELFTLGIGHYTEEDIKNAARAFTGWGHDGDEFVYRRPEHDFGEKVFFGKRGNFDGDDVIDIILSHPHCAKHIGRKLYAFFVEDQPEEALVESLGDLLRGGKYELRPPLRTILTSKVFYRPEVIGGQIKSPVQLVVGTTRLLGTPLPPTRFLMGLLEQMGQRPMDPPNVKGWAGGRTWINTSTLFVRYNAAVMLAGGSPAMGTGAGRFFDAAVAVRGREGFSPKGGSNAEAVVEEWVGRLIQRPIEAEKKKVLVEAVGGKPESEDAVRRVVQLIVSMPEYQLC
jgi:hypothetical protein